MPETKPPKTLSPAFTEKFATFYAGVQKIHEDYVVAHFALNARKPWRLDYGAVRVRVVHDGAVFCFVDYTTGDVLKAAGWKGPAKHARGNIFDAANGLAAIGPYGPAYLR